MKIFNLQNNYDSLCRLNENYLNFPRIYQPKEPYLKPITTQAPMYQKMCHERNPQMRSVEDLANDTSFVFTQPSRGAQIFFEDLTALAKKVPTTQATPFGLAFDGNSIPIR